MMTTRTDRLATTLTLAAGREATGRREATGGRAPAGRLVSAVLISALGGLLAAPAAEAGESSCRLDGPCVAPFSLSDRAPISIDELSTFAPEAGLDPSHDAYSDPFAGPDPRQAAKQAPGAAPNQATGQATAQAPDVAAEASAASSPAPSAAAETAGDPFFGLAMQTGEPQGWTFRVSPYVWAAGLRGNVAAFGAPPAHVDLSFSDILEDLDLTAMLAGEARYGRASLNFDLVYLSLSDAADLPVGTGATRARLSTETLMATAVAAYDVISRREGRLSVALGARYWSVSDDLRVTGGRFDGLHVKDSAEWVDVMTGLRGLYRINDSLYVNGWALAGGGGSRFSWDVMAGLGYRFTSGINGVIGYRAVAVDYESGAFEFSPVIQGPLAGVSFRF